MARDVRAWLRSKSAEVMASRLQREVPRIDCNQIFAKAGVQPVEESSRTPMLGGSGGIA